MTSRLLVATSGPFYCQELTKVPFTAWKSDVPCAGMVKKLRRDEWRPMGQGEEWYSYRFQR